MNDVPTTGEGSGYIAFATKQSNSENREYRSAPLGENTAPGVFAPGDEGKISVRRVCHEAIQKARTGSTGRHHRAKTPLLRSFYPATRGGSEYIASAAKQSKSENPEYGPGVSGENGSSGIFLPDDGGRISVRRACHEVGDNREPGVRVGSTSKNPIFNHLLVAAPRRRQRNAAVAAWVLEVLRDADAKLRRGDVPVDALNDDRTTDTLWLEIIRPAILPVAGAGYVETDDDHSGTGESGSERPLSVPPTCPWYGRESVYL